MRMLWITLLVVAAPCLGTLHTSSAGAAPFELNDATWEGCADLLDLARRELGEDRVLVWSTLDWEEVKASDGVLVLHPTNAMDPEEAAAFMKAGGRLAVVDDFGRGEALLSHFKIHRRSLPSQPSAYLRSKPALAIATPAMDTDGEEVLGMHPTVAEVEQVVLNHGTGLVHPDLTPVLEVRANRTDPVAVAVAGQIEGDRAKGRLFAMGDPSAFINMMLRYPGNRAFAAGVVHYLADGDATEPRKGRLFIVANNFGERGSFGGVTPLRKTLDRKFEAMVDAFNGLRQDGFPWWLHILAAGLVALVVLWWVLKRLSKLYRIRLPRFARGVPLVAQGGLAGHVAVLSTKVAPPALAMLEIRRALGDLLGDYLQMPRDSHADALLQKLETRATLSTGLQSDLRQVLATMRGAEMAVVAGGGARINRKDVRHAWSVVDRLIAEADIDVPWPQHF